MRTNAPPLLAIFRSQLQGEVLADLFLVADAPTLSELAMRLGAPVSTVQREVARLADAGILTTCRSGRGRVVSINEHNPANRPLRELVEVTFGPRWVLAEEFARIEGVDELAIFGSWAARHHGVAGASPGDIDVLIVGSPDRNEVYDAADRSQRRLHREVNTTVMAPDRWASDAPFVVDLRSRPMVVLMSSESGDDLEHGRRRHQRDAGTGAA